MLYTDEFRPVRNKTSYCNIDVGKQKLNEQIFPTSDAVSLLKLKKVKKTKTQSLFTLSTTLWSAKPLKASVCVSSVRTNNTTLGHSI